MGQRIATFSAQADTTQTVTLGGVQYRLRLAWRDRPRAWYMDLSTAAGVGIVAGRRMAAGWCPLAGLSSEAAPDGYLYVRGVDGYARDDLGGGLQVLYYGADEVARSGATDLGLTVTL